MTVIHYINNDISSTFSNIVDNINSSNNTNNYNNIIISRACKTTTIDMHNNNRMTRVSINIKEAVFAHLTSRTEAATETGGDHNIEQMANRCKTRKIKFEDCILIDGAYFHIDQTGKLRPSPPMQFNRQLRRTKHLQPKRMRRPRQQHSLLQLPNLTK